jgi:hypothetical protein
MFHTPMRGHGNAPSSDLWRAGAATWHPHNSTTSAGVGFPTG